MHARTGLYTSSHCRNTTPFALCSRCLSFRIYILVTPVSSCVWRRGRGEREGREGGERGREEREGREEGERGRGEWKERRWEGKEQEREGCAMDNLLSVEELESCQ